MHQVNNCILLGNNVIINEQDYQFALSILGIGVIRTIMTPEEFQVVNEVITRSLADFYFELSKKQYDEPPKQEYNVHRIEKED